MSLLEAARITQVMDELYCAVSNGRHFVVKILLDCNPAIKDILASDMPFDSSQAPLLLIAVNSGDPRTVAALLDAGANPNVSDDRGRSALLIARYEQEDQIVDLLTAAGAKEDPTKNDTYNEKWHISREEAVDITKKEVDGLTSRLESGEAFWETQCAKFLVAGDFSSEDSSGRDALLMAAWQGNTDIVKYLVSQGVNVNTFDKNGRTPLSIASEFGYIDIVAFLLDNHANINITNEAGRNPLMTASLRVLSPTTNHVAVIRLLLSKGANVNWKDKDGYTALALAGDPNIIDILKAAGAKK